MRSTLRQLGRDTLYVLVGLPLAVIVFSLVVTGIATGAGLLVTLAGLPVLVGTAYLARGFATLERARIAPVLRRPTVLVRYRPRTGGAWRRLLTPLADAQSWLDLGHAIIRFPVSVTTFSIVVSWWGVALGGLTRPLYDGALPPDIAANVGVVVNNRSLPELLGLTNTSLHRSLVYVGVGLVFALTLVPVTRVCALAEAWLAHGLLNGLAGLRSQVETAQARTVAATEAEATSLRRLERDIHDGPQQRLVRLAVDLGRARAQLDTDPDAARGTIDEAMTQTREALDELRTLSRGIAPPILTDRGLAAALDSLAARATVPVELDLALDGPLPPLVEQVAYFTVAEALTNVAKHAQATQARVRIERRAASAGDGGSAILIVTVTDDGMGGAHVAKGTGLAGLADRLQAAGGSLRVDSPPGGPTEISARIPCA